MKHMTFPRLLVVAVALNLLLSVTASPFYVGLQPPDPQPGDECEVVEICICPLVFCELGMWCYEMGHNCGTGPKK